MRSFLPLCLAVLTGCGADAVTAADAAAVDPCPSTAAFVATGATCGTAGGERFGNECATQRARVPAACVSAFDALVRCASTAPATCNATGGFQRPAACDPRIEALSACASAQNPSDAAAPSD